MLSTYDDYLIHQSDRPLAEIISQDPNWEEAIYFNMHDRSGEFAAICGLDVFPNAQYMAAWLIALHNGEHYTHMCAGPLGNWREELQVGTLSFSIVEPMRRWRLQLADEANGIRADLDFRARCPAYHFRPIRCDSAGEVVFNQSYYNQAGVYGGTVTVGDRVFSDLWGLRARRWGAFVMHRIPFYNWVSIQLATRVITFWQFESYEGDILYSDGAVVTAAGAITPITRIEHDWTLAPGARHPSGARLALSLASGETVHVATRELGSLFTGAFPSRWSDTDATALAAADAAAASIEEYCEFSVGGERGIGIHDIVSRPGYQRYGLAPLGGS